MSLENSSLIELIISVVMFDFSQASSYTNTQSYAKSEK